MELKAYKIKNASGLFKSQKRSNGQHQWGKRGHIWTNIGHIKTHLFGETDIPDDWELWMWDAQGEHCLGKVKAMLAK